MAWMNSRRLPTRRPRPEPFNCRSLSSCGELPIRRNCVAPRTLRAAQSNTPRAGPCPRPVAPVLTQPCGLVGFSSPAGLHSALCNPAETAPRRPIGASGRPQHPVSRAARGGRAPLWPARAHEVVEPAEVLLEHLAVEEEQQAPSGGFCVEAATRALDSRRGAELRDLCEERLADAVREPGRRAGRADVARSRAGAGRGLRRGDVRRRTLGSRWMLRAGVAAMRRTSGRTWADIAFSIEQSWDQTRASRSPRNTRLLMTVECGLPKIVSSVPIAGQRGRGSSGSRSASTSPPSTP